jgi:hypothetical protein
MAKSQKKTTRERDPWFNPYREPASDRARVALGEIIFGFEKQENRKRRRRPKDIQWLWNVSVVRSFARGFGVNYRMDQLI